MVNSKRCRFDTLPLFGSPLTTDTLLQGRIVNYLSEEGKRGPYPGALMLVPNVGNYILLYVKRQFYNNRYANTRTVFCRRAAWSR